MSCSRTKHSDPGEAQNSGPSVLVKHSTIELMSYHYASQSVQFIYLFFFFHFFFFLVKNIIFSFFFLPGVRSAMRAASQLPGKGPTDVDDAPAPAR